MSHQAKGATVEVDGVNIGRVTDDNLADVIIDDRDERLSGSVAMSLSASGIAWAFATAVIEQESRRWGCPDLDPMAPRRPKPARSHPEQYRRIQQAEERRRRRNAKRLRDARRSERGTA